VRFLSADGVRRALPMPEAIAVMKRALAALSAGEAVIPLRTHLALADPPGDALVMPAYVPADGRLGAARIDILRKRLFAWTPKSALFGPRIVVSGP